MDRNKKILIIAVASAITFMLSSIFNVLLYATERHKYKEVLAQKTQIISQNLKTDNSYLKIKSENEKIKKQQNILNKDFLNKTNELTGLINNNKLLQEKYDSLLKKVTSGELSEYKVYLTFDDGPSADITPKILDTLHEYNVKATFFVLGSQISANSEILKRIAKEGHVIGVHSYSHIYKNVYSSKEAFFQEFDSTEKLILEQTGIKPTLFRFPGGSNSMYSTKEFIDQIKPELINRGYNYVDWNVTTGDASTNIPNGALMVSNVIAQADSLKKKGAKILVVLAHDTKGKNYTADVLAQIIIGLTEHGFSFDTLKTDTVVPHFR